jgi:TolB protein
MILPPARPPRPGPTRCTPRLAIGVAPILAAIALATLGLGLPAQEPQQPPPAPAGQAQQPSEVSATITSGEGGAAPRFAVPEFVALSPDAETRAIARTIAQVLFDDLAFEREFALIPRDTYTTIPPATSFADVPFARWAELNADGVVIGTVQKTGTLLRVEVRLFNVRTRQSAFGREYDGSAANPRLYAHTISDELHQQQRGLRGVARTKLTFDSDRDGERMLGTIENRGVKEIYICDYDGENQRRITVGRTLNITPTWSPDARSIAYTSYRAGPPEIFIQSLYQAMPPQQLTKNAGNNFLPAWSPDGTRLCFMSTRDGNPELYVVNRDGSNLRRLTHHPAIDTSPTWSPSGTEIAFTSDRSGTPQIYVVGADGLGLRKITAESYADRPTWSPAPYNEIAFASRTGAGFDIKVYELATGQVRQLTFGEGTNESPAYAANGRHLVFMSTRGAGKSQIYTIARDGKNLKQITRTGNNQQPDWSH